MMRTLFMVGILALSAGCTLGEPEKPDVPMPTDGANQVVIKVPGMTCEECPVKVASALASIPWIEADSIKADRKTRQVIFTVKNRAQFDIETVSERVRKAGYAGTKLLSGPTEK
jgi:copper chaperone CopZ